MTYAGFTDMLISQGLMNILTYQHQKHQYFPGKSYARQEQLIVVVRLVQGFVILFAQQLLSFMTNLLKLLPVWEIRRSLKLAVLLGHLLRALKIFAG